jgi:SAM-dependent methyltransferase
VAPERFAELARRLWLRALVGPTRFSDNAPALNRLYLVKDPWRLRGETARYDWTGAILRREFGRPASLLEVGCGEGHHTRRLLAGAGAVTGLEVSSRAARRARRRCPSAEVLVGGLDAPELAGRRFDVALACEVLYYMADPPGALDRLEALADGWLVTYYDGERAALDAAVLSRPGVRSERFSSGKTAWTAAWRRR